MNHSRWKTAKEHSPDPVSSRAFMSEFKQGLNEGTENIPYDMVAHTTQETEMLVVEAAGDLLELAKRIENHASSTQGISVNERRLVPKMSGILSTLFYNLGKLRGLKRV